MADSENILEILTRAKRPTFGIDGKRYEMRHPNELSMMEFKRLGHLGAKVQKAGNVATEGKGFDELVGTVNELLDLVAPDLPKKARDKLNPFHAMQIVEAFLGLVRASGSPDERPSRRKSSRGSAGSTRGRRRSTG